MAWTDDDLMMFAVGLAVGAGWNVAGKIEQGAA